MYTSAEMEVIKFHTGQFFLSGNINVSFLKNDVVSRFHSNKGLRGPANSLAACIATSLRSTAFTQKLAEFQNKYQLSIV